jgi:DNA-binding IclR family transcriptional regulator
MGVRSNIELAKSGDAENDRQYIKSLSRGLELLRAFKAEDQGLKNSELAIRTGYPKSTVSRITFTLMSLGYLRLDEATGHYSLHPHILSLGYPVLQNMSIREYARPLMQDLSNSNRTTTGLGVHDGLSMIIIERVRHRSLMSQMVDIGVGRDLATTALGRAYLAALPKAKQSSLMKEIRIADEERWPIIEAAIEANLENYATHGYCYSIGEWQTNHNAVGAPFISRDGTIFSFTCGGPRDQITKDKLSEIGPKLVAMIAELTKMHR